MNRDELIALARKLYDGGKGISYGKISEKFNADGVATLSGKGSWEKKMVSRLIAADALKKVEVKLGMKTDREVQLESEIESLKSDLESQLVDVERLQSEKAELARKNQYLTERLADSAGHVNGNLELIADLESQNEYLKSENVGLRSDRDEALKELNKVKQEYDRLSETYRDQLGTVPQTINDLKQRVAGFDTENQQLHRMLNEAELKYKTLYESEISRLGSELAVANQKIQELRDKQTFLKLESESGMPKNFMGWTVQKRHDGRGINLFRKVSGKLRALYVGKEWNESDARNKIAAFEQKQKPQSELFGTECKSCHHQPEFEHRLRSVCPETVRTYRLDTVAGHFPDCAFGTEMIALAEQKRIELLAGDPSQCDVSKLISYRGRMYVNFEWR